MACISHLWHMNRTRSQLELRWLGLPLQTEETNREKLLCCLSESSIVPPGNVITKLWITIRGLITGTSLSKYRLTASTNPGYVVLNCMPLSCNNQLEETRQELPCNAANRRQYFKAMGKCCYLGNPPKSHSAQMYGPGRRITHRPISAAKPT